MLRVDQGQEPGRSCNPYSTGITLQLIPKAAVDKIPMLSMAYGLSASADGNIFPWIFNPPVTYWDGASVFIKHAAEKEGGLDKLKGKKIGLIHLDAPYGKEPIPLLEALAKDLRLRAEALSGRRAGHAEPGLALAQRSAATGPTGSIIQGWGAMNPTAVKEAVKTGFPMNKLVGVWWAGGDDDARAGGAEAKGYKSLDFHAVGADFPVIKDIQKHVVDKGLSKCPKEKVGENLYNRGVYNSMLIAEAIRNRAEDHRQEGGQRRGRARGLEALNITEARLKELGMEGFAAPVKVSCEDHNGHHKVFVAEWDGTKWTEGLRLDRADEGQGPAAARGRRQGLRREEHRLAEALGELRQAVVEPVIPDAPQARSGIHARPRRPGGGSRLSAALRPG